MPRKFKRLMPSVSIQAQDFLSFFFFFYVIIRGFMYVKNLNVSIVIYFATYVGLANDNKKVLVFAS